MSRVCLFHMPGSCSRVVMNALEETGINYEDRAVNLFKGEQRLPEMLAINPKGKVPALRVCDTLLTENPSILLYLDETHPGIQLMPPAANAVERASARADLIWLSSSVHPLVRICMMPARLAPGDPDGARAVALGQLNDVFVGIEQRLTHHPWWFGGAWSIIDVYVYWCISTAAVGGMNLSVYPGILSHAERVRARPSFQRALAREKYAVDRENIQLPLGARL